MFDRSIRNAATTINTEKYWRRGDERQQISETFHCSGSCSKDGSPILPLHRASTRANRLWSPGGSRVSRLSFLGDVHEGFGLILAGEDVIRAL